MFGGPSAMHNVCLTRHQGYKQAVCCIRGYPKGAALATCTHLATTPLAPASTASVALRVAVGLLLLPLPLLLLCLRRLHNLDARQDEAAGPGAHHVGVRSGGQYLRSSRAGHAHMHHHHASVRGVPYGM